MSQPDIVVAGGGLAGSTAAAMLGRAGYRVLLVDPHQVYPPELRCEKLDGGQVRILRRTGLADAVLDKATFDGTAWVARFGRLLDRKPSDQHGILYDTLVNTLRGEAVKVAHFVNAKVTAIATSDERQRVTLSDGSEVSPRLVVLANGLNISLRHSLGLQRQELSRCHSITLGFDMRPLHRASFAFPALTYYPERTSDRMAYLSLFPIGASMRANLMVYRDMNDPWLRRMRHEPVATLRETLPGLAKLVGAFEVVGPVKIRPADLYVTSGHRQPGIVLVGDAFCTSCPAAGTGAGKVFMDVERLCNAYVPRWFASEGMGVDKIAAYYDDPLKTAYDAESLAKAYHLRALSIDEAPAWRVRWRVKFLARMAVGALRSTRLSLAGGDAARSLDLDARPMR